MKIVLRDDVEKLGRKGDIVEVAPGYARNYLVPKGLAIAATRGIVAQAEAMSRSPSLAPCTTAHGCSSSTSRRRRSACASRAWC